jgi:hypothetical protein
MSEVKSNRVFARSYARVLTAEECASVAGGADSNCFGSTGGGSDSAEVKGDDITVPPNQG